MKRTLSIISFLVRIYSTVVAATLLFTGILIVANINSQITLSSSLMAQKLAKVIESNQSELLQEIVLGDFDSLQEHLEILAKELNADEMILNTPAKRLITHNASGGMRDLTSIDMAIIRFLKIAPFHYSIRNYFGQEFGSIDVSYSENLYTHTLYPMMKQARLVSCIVLCFFLLLFVYVYIKFVRHVAKPLNKLSSFLKGAQAKKGATLEHKIDGIDEIIEVNNTLIEYDRLKHQMARLQVEAERAQIARQVVHDIRGPLAALEAVSANLMEVPEEKRTLLRSALLRIQDISNNLIEKYRSTASDTRSSAMKVRTELLSNIVEEMLSEKRVQYASRRTIEIVDRRTGDSYGLFASVHAGTLKRILSNLIDNAIEAIPERGTVSVSAYEDAGFVVLAVEDTGTGIPPELVSRVTEQGVTSKKRGLGLGLFHAKQVLAEWQGRLAIESEVGKGTCVEVRLKKSRPPAWFVDRIRIGRRTEIVVVDDEATIEYVWGTRLKAAPVKGVRSFRSISEFRKWYRFERDLGGSYLFCVDFEFQGENQTGIEIISELALSDSAILVTNRSDEFELQDRCAQSRMRLMSKREVPFVPIEYVELADRTDAVIIDDDELVHATWQVKAKSCGKTVRTFRTVAEFMQAKEHFSPDIPIYIDVNLGEGVRGDRASKELFECGFSNLYLATGYEPNEFANLPWIQGVVRKEPPWA